MRITFGPDTSSVNDAGATYLADEHGFVEVPESVGVRLLTQPGWRVADEDDEPGTVPEGSAGVEEPEAEPLVVPSEAPVVPVEVSPEVVPPDAPVEQFPPVVGPERVPTEAEPIPTEPEPIPTETEPLATEPEPLGTGPVTAEIDLSELPPPPE